MTRLGPALLVMALVLEAYGIGASIYGARTGKGQWIVSGRRAVYALAGLMTLCFAILEAAFLRSDFHLEVVAGHSSTTTPGFYRAAAMWSSQEGSLVLWVWLLSLWSSLALWLVRGRMRQVAAYGQAVLLGFAAFFTGLLVFATHPFAQLHPAPSEGVGLNPLLRHPSMMIHPPMLYSGYTLFAIPFAFAIGALAAGRLDADWIRSTRRFALLAWLCLGFGILLGARWSYAELGWGGYWAWDPVENASLMPLLTGTAFLHSIQVQEKRGMLKVWNVSLVLATGVLAIMGTFLVRSGVLSSIHAFGASTLGRPFLAFIALLVFGSLFLVLRRRAELRSEAHLDSLLSREAAFLLNNLLLVGLCFVVFWGTFYPLISEAFTGTRAAVGPPWFDRYITPLALVLVLLSGVGPALAWGRFSREAIVRRFALPTAVASAALPALLALGVGTGHPFALALFCLAAFTVAATVQEVWLAARARREATGEPAAYALARLVGRNRRRYGGYLVHLGVAVLIVGVAASSAFQHNRMVRLNPGQSARLDGYDVTYVRPTSHLSGEKVSLGAVLEVTRDGRHVATLLPTRGYYPSLDQQSLGRIGRFFNGDSTSEVGLRSGPTRDLWTAVQPDLGPIQRYMTDADRRFPDANAPLEGFLVSTLVRRYLAGPAAAEFRIVVSPFVAWVWIGGLIVVAGAMVSLWPAPLRRRALAPARLRPPPAPAPVRHA